MKRSVVTLTFLAVLTLSALSITYAKLPDDAPVTHGIASQFTGMGAGTLHQGAGLPSILAVIDSREDFSNFRRAVERASLTQTLDSKGPFTVFVPTDEAFNRLPSAEEEEILRDPQTSKAVVLNQMTDGYLAYGASGPQDLSRVGFIVTEDGNRIPIIVGRKDLRVGQSHLVKANIRASNGIIHVVDQVILPQSSTP
jgi:uncharacterized surface protein with fasciclin (FAS1) repeats